MPVCCLPCAGSMLGHERTLANAVRLPSSALLNTRASCGRPASTCRNFGPFCTLQLCIRACIPPADAPETSLTSLCLQDLAELSENFIKVAIDQEDQIRSNQGVHACDMLAACAAGILTAIALGDGSLLLSHTTSSWPLAKPRALLLWEPARISRDVSGLWVFLVRLAAGAVAVHELCISQPLPSSCIA